jgi:hypothetical protein
MRDFNEKQIKELIGQDEMAARQMVIKDEDLSDTLRIAKGLIEKLNFDAAPWGDVIETWGHIVKIGHQINHAVERITNTLNTQGAAKSADEMLSAGFEFDKIQIGPVSLVCGDGGLYADDNQRYSGTEIPF